MSFRTAIQTPGTLVGRLPMMICALTSVILAAPAAHAQAAGYDTSLRSIAPATINQASFDIRARSQIQSIGSAGVENRATMVPAVYDPSLGRFVSALGSAPGAISVSSSSVVSVVVSQQSNVFVVGAGSSGSAMRSEAAAAPSASVTTTQLAATPASNR